MPGKWDSVENLNDASFSSLINTSGRQRMLSQRILMLILHCQLMLQQQSQIENSESLELLRGAINTFKTNHHNLTHGNTNENIPIIPSERLDKKLHNEGVEALITSFIQRASRCYTSLSNGNLLVSQELDALVSDTAKHILTQLNELTSIFETEFNEYASEKKRLIESQSNNVLSAIHTIKKISKQTDIISINSKIVASRAGEAGKQFKVIADRLQSLNKDIEASSDEIIDYLELVLNSNTGQ